MNRRIFLCVFGMAAAAAEQHAVTGVVLRVDRAHASFTASCAAVPAYMEAMVMNFSVRDVKSLASIEPGMNVAFTLVVNGSRSYAESIHALQFENMEQEPLRARRLQLLQEGGEPAGLARGQSVPDFTLLDQTGRPLRFDSLAGKVVAVDFIYTSCPLPDYCFRLSNNFARVARRFVGSDVVFLSISFDPVHDRPEVLAKYARTWKADPRTWLFLTGDLAAVKSVCHTFGLNFWQDEGALTHSLRTVVVDRQGSVAGNLDGNRFTAEQLGDFIAAVLNAKVK